KEKGVSFGKVEHFLSVEGKGVKGEMDGKKVVVGRPSFLSEEGVMRCAGLDIKAAQFQDDGKTAIHAGVDGKAVAVFALADTLKAGAKEVIEELNSEGIASIMLTGDNTKTAQAIARKLGLTDFIAEVYPQDKANKVKEIQARGIRVAMVGDGINDAPALTQADIGIAMGTGTDIAIESAGITLLGGDIAKIPQAFRLSRKTLRIIKQNLFWAFIYNVLGIPVAAGILYPFFGILLSPILASIAMAASSISVVGNSLRLTRIRL
ncbi:HAD-IC family P-type ATPase, partial [Candidatus Peregrinibacteria bacterium]|nr:HAD-IC family P-type ATPase [Candidatus Peregrinibacteria bacterium]